MDSDTACSKGGKHKLVEDHESGEEICTKCGITIKMNPAGYRDPHGKPKESSQGPVTSKGSLGANVSGKEFQAPAGSRGKYLRHYGHDPFSEPEVKMALTPIENATWNEGQKTRALDLFQTTRKKLKGKNLTPFMNINNIWIPRQSFETYYQAIGNVIAINLQKYNSKKGINSKRTLFLRYLLSKFVFDLR